MKAGIFQEVYIVIFNTFFNFFTDAREDARHIISNSKDQSIKLWDLRRFANNQCISLTKDAIRHRGPDDEGYCIVDRQWAKSFYLGTDSDPRLKQQSAREIAFANVDDSIIYVHVYIYKHVAWVSWYGWTEVRTS